MAFSLLSSTSKDLDLRLSFQKSAELDRPHQSDFRIEIPSTHKAQERLHRRLNDQLTSLNGDITSALLHLDTIKAYRQGTRAQPYLRWIGSRRRVNLPADWKGKTQCEIDRGNKQTEEGDDSDEGEEEEAGGPSNPGGQTSTADKKVQRLSLACQSWFREAAAASTQYLDGSSLDSPDTALDNPVGTDDETSFCSVSTATSDSSFHMHRVGRRPHPTPRPNSAQGKRRDSLWEASLEAHALQQTQHDTVHPAAASTLLQKRQGHDTGVATGKTDGAMYGQRSEPANKTTVKQSGNQQPQQTDTVESAKTSLDQPRHAQELRNPRIRKKNIHSSFSQSEGSSRKPTPTVKDGTKNTKRDGSSLYSRTSEGLPSKEWKGKSLDDDIEIPLPLTLHKQNVHAALVNGLHSEDHDSSLDTIKADQDVTPAKSLPSPSESFTHAANHIAVRKTRHTRKVIASEVPNPSESIVIHPARKSGPVKFRDSVTAYSDHLAKHVNEESPSYPDIRKVPNDDWSSGIPFMFNTPEQQHSQSGSTSILAGDDNSRQVSVSTAGSRRPLCPKDAPNYGFTLYPAGQNSRARPSLQLPRDNAVRIANSEMQAVPPIDNVSAKKNISNPLMGNTGTIKKLKSGFLRNGTGNANGSGADEPKAYRSSIDIAGHHPPGAWKGPFLRGPKHVGSVDDHLGGKGTGVNSSNEWLGRPSEDSRGSSAALSQSRWSSPSASSTATGGLKKKHGFMGSVRNGLMRMGSVKHGRR